MSVYEGLIRFVDRKPIPSILQVGEEGEHNVQEVRMDNLPQISPDQVASMYILLPDGTSGDAELIVDNKVTLTRTLMQAPGYLTCWIVISVSDVMVWKSDIFKLKVSDLPSIEEAIEQQYPSAFETAINITGTNAAAARAAADEAEDYRDDAAASAETASTAAASASNSAQQAAGSAESAANSADEAAEYTQYIEDYVDDAAASANSAAQSASAAGASAQQAGQYADVAQAASIGVAHYADEAEDYAAIAASSAQQAGQYATAAGVSASQASTYSSNASQKASAAEQSANAAASSASEAAASADLILGMNVEATTLAPGSQATADYQNGVLTLGLPQGAVGETGPKGDTGVTGPKGDKGDKGDTGATGPQGPKGDTGETGPKGDTGEQGPKGDKGDKGDTGAAGPKGDTGETGPQGPKGDTGEQGPKGDTGEQGPKGDTGDSGVYVGTTTPTDPDVNVWIDPSGTAPDLTPAVRPVYASGSMVHITDGADNAKIESLKVHLMPLQEGSGDPSPSNVRAITGWTGANVTVSGKNLFKFPTYEEITACPTTNGYYNFAIKAKKNTNYYVTNTCNAGFDPMTHGYVLLARSKTNDNWKALAHQTQGQTSGIITTLADGMLYFNATEIGNKAKWEEIRDNVQTMLTEGSEATPYTPYSGTTVSVEFPMMGANQWDEEWELGAIDTSRGILKPASNQIRSKNYIPVQPNTIYRGVGTAIWAFAYDSNKNPINEAMTGTRSGYASLVERNTFTTPADCRYIMFYALPAYGTIYNNDIAINYPATIATYEAYKGRTVYSGTIDPVTGEGVVTHGMVDLGSLTWLYTLNWNNAPVFYSQNLPLNNGNDSKVTCICSQHKAVTANELWTNTAGSNIIAIASSKMVYVRDTAYTDAATFEAAMSGVQLVYELATPITFHVDPQALTTLLGENNIWSDVGNVEVTYAADIGLYISEHTVSDVQVNGTSVVNDGVANVPIATGSTPGVVKIEGSYGVGFVGSNNKQLTVVPPALDTIKPGTTPYRPITPSVQHASAFYGLAKAAGDTSQAQSNNAVGTYTEEAKAAIREMLGIRDWKTAILSESDYDSSLGMFILDVGTGKEIAEARVIGQVVWDTQIASGSKLAIGFGDVASRDLYNSFTIVTIQSAANRVSFSAEGKNQKATYTNGTIYRTQYGYGYYGNSANASHYVNVDIVSSLAMAGGKGTSWYHNFNDPRYFHITVPPTPDWAFIQVEYKLR